MGPIYEEDLVNGYAVWAADTMKDAMIVHKKDKEHSYSTRVVQPMVFAYGWNDDFIIAKQHPSQCACLCHFERSEAESRNLFLIDFSTSGHLVALRSK
jgi:hypothetical protein